MENRPSPFAPPLMWEHDTEIAGSCYYGALGLKEILRRDFLLNLEYSPSSFILPFLSSLSPSSLHVIFQAIFKQG